MEKTTSYIGGIQRFSTEDGPGIRTTIFLNGCVLRCRWCHNPELMNPGYAVLQHPAKCILCGECARVCPSGSITVQDGAIHLNRDTCLRCGACVEHCCSGALFTKSVRYTMAELMAQVEKDRSFYESSGGGVTLSGGEILTHGAYALEIAEELNRRGISLSIETSGFGNYDDLLALAQRSDWILFDLKHMDPAAHLRCTGVAPDRIWENLSKLAATPAIAPRITIRVPLLAGINDSEENLRAVAAFMHERGLHTIHLLPYHNMGLSKARQAGIEQEEFETPSDEVLESRRLLLQGLGLHVTVMGHED